MHLTTFTDSKLAWTLHLRRNCKRERCNPERYANLWWFSVYWMSRPHGFCSHHCCSVEDFYQLNFSMTVNQFPSVAFLTDDKFKFGWIPGISFHWISVTFLSLNLSTCYPSSAKEKPTGVLFMSGMATLQEATVSLVVSSLTSANTTN